MHRVRIYWVSLLVVLVSLMTAAATRAATLNYTALGDSIAMDPYFPDFAPRAGFARPGLHDYHLVAARTSRTD